MYVCMGLSSGFVFPPPPHGAALLLGLDEMTRLGVCAGWRSRNETSGWCSIPGTILILESMMSSRAGDWIYYAWQFVEEATVDG